MYAPAGAGSTAMPPRQQRSWEGLAVAGPATAPTKRRMPWERTAHARWSGDLKGGRESSSWAAAHSRGSTPSAFSIRGGTRHQSRGAARSGARRLLLDGPRAGSLPPRVTRPGASPPPPESGWRRSGPVSGSPASNSPPGATCRAFRRRTSNGWRRRPRSAASCPRPWPRSR